jgi:hypothetical protein
MTDPSSPTPAHGAPGASMLRGGRTSRRARGMVTAVAALALAGSALAWWAHTGSYPREPVYTVAALRAHLERNPHAWLQRTVRVHAIPVLRWCFVWTTPGPNCQLWEPALVSTGPNTGLPLPLTWGSTPRELTFLRHVPLLGALVSPPQTILWAAPSIYRVRLQTTSCFSPGLTACYQAIVLNASS